MHVIITPPKIQIKNHLIVGVPLIFVYPSLGQSIHEWTKYKNFKDCLPQILLGLFLNNLSTCNLVSENKRDTTEKIPGNATLATYTYYTFGHINGNLTIKNYFCRLRTLIIRSASLIPLEYAPCVVE